MWCNWRRNKKEGSVSFRSLFNKSECLTSNEIGGVVSFVIYWIVFIMLKCWILVVVGIWIEEEIGGCETVYIRIIVIVYCV
jgi:hypothetical protein